MPEARRRFAPDEMRIGGLHKALQYSVDMSFRTATTFDPLSGFAVSVGGYELKARL
jgi:hypothetical protein